ncbi:hypothetical protein MTP99_005671 [Tenebrio molitor]|uniref:keratin-associated protein 10-5-like isoform X1 n=1 Tax=Tenebrio molitor TaxID=7067 RepID=UPI00270F2546|nr:hypothetical protein MTP99_005671 [Tenebrio molitor]
MSCCARCGQGICSTAGKIALNKVWHKGCFCCYNCNRPLHVSTAKIYYGEVFCSCCCPQVQEVYPVKVCRVNSTPSFNPDCCPQPVCCNSSESDYCRPRDVHSCSCIPACCDTTNRCSCGECEDNCFKRIHCRPRSPKPLNYPPRQRSPRCPCSKCCTKNRRRNCQEPPCPVRKKPPCVNNTVACCEGKKKMLFFQPCANNNRCNNNYCCKCCTTERCKRCGEKVFAAEKVLTSYGAYHLGCFSCYCCCKSLCVKTMYEACGEIYCRQCYNNYFGVSGYGYTCC